MDKYCAYRFANVCRVVSVFVFTVVFSTIVSSSAYASLNLEVTPAPPASLDLSSGVAAFERGDYKQAYQTLLHLADKENSPHAQFLLARMYEQGNGVEQDNQMALSWLNLAAQAGLADAQHLLGEYYLAGDLGLDADSEKAAGWLQRAINSGAKQAHTALGLAYLTGGTLEPDSTRAIYHLWQGLDAKWEHDVAQTLSVLLIEQAQRQNSPPGSVLSTDIERLLTQLAQDGDVHAQNDLGAFYVQGTFLEKDLVKAYVWFSFAGQMGLAQAQDNLLAIEPLMSAEQIEQANRMMEKYAENIE